MKSQLLRICSLSISELNEGCVRRHHSAATVSAARGTREEKWIRGALAISCEEERMVERWRRRAVLMMLATVSDVAQARAAEGVSLSWTAPPSCPTRDDVLLDVESILRDSGARHGVDATAVVTRAASGDRWSVELAISSHQGAGERVFDASSCEQLARAVALIVALAVDPTRTVVAKPEAPPPPPPPPPASPSLGPALRLGIFASGVTEVGTLPELAVGFEGGLALRYGRGRLDGYASLWGSQRAADPLRPAQGVDLALVGAGGRACVAVLRTRNLGADLSPCLGLDLQRMVGEGYGTGATAFTQDGVWTTGRAGVLGSWFLLPSLAVRVSADVLAPLARPSFVVLGADGSVTEVLHRPATFGARFGAGAELFFF